MDALKNEMKELQSAFDLQEVLKRLVKFNNKNGWGWVRQKLPPTKIDTVN